MGSVGGHMRRARGPARVRRFWVGLRGPGALGRGAPGSEAGRARGSGTVVARYIYKMGT